MARSLCRLRRNCELSSLLAQQGIEEKKRKAVLDALHRAPDDNPVLVFFWDQRALDRTCRVDAKKFLLNALMDAVPNVTHSIDFPDEVFNLESFNDLYAMRNKVLEIGWARGDALGAAPLVGQPLVARTLLITDTKKKVPTFSNADLFT